jgi:hypothetical protein
VEPANMIELTLGSYVHGGRPEGIVTGDAV